ncbi:MAG: diguanylate cyclase [Deltaproteobacteria bacterium]|nr:diguanylate cyclase [Deltaproteobacteria bacterium]
MREWLGYDDNELLAMTLQDLRAPGDGQESRYRKKDGEDVDVEEVRTKIPFHEKDGLLVIAHDISEHKRVEELLDRLSRHDGLTGIANRRHFDEVLEQEWKRALRERTNLSLILCDIDFFKAFNDTYGHQQGDECLQAVAGALVQHMRRPMDLASRYGGEEFSVILPDTPREGALIVAEELRSGVEALGIPHASSAAGPVVTISLGIATLIPRTDKSPAELIGAADNALYRAKAEGRNRSAS